MMVVMMPDVDAGEEGGEQCQGCNVGPDIRMLYTTHWYLVTEKLSLQETDNKTW